MNMNGGRGGDVVMKVLLSIAAGNMAVLPPVAQAESLKQISHNSVTRSVSGNPIDMGLKYATFLGGRDDDEYNGTYMALGPDGSIFVAGTTFSSDFPTTPGAFDSTYDGGGDIFVAKFNPDGSNLVYSTFIGGADTDDTRALNVDPAGAAYVSGLTRSEDFPTTPASFSPDFNGGCCDGFVVKLDPSGSTLGFSTFLGGADSTEVVSGLATLGDGTVYATGQTLSEDFPTTAGAYDRLLNDGGVGVADDAFVSVLTPDGSVLVYSTFLGGDHNDYGYAITVGPGATAYVTGEAQSADFPTTPGAFDETYNGGGDPYVTRLSTDGSAVVSSTFTGGSAIDRGIAITLDSMGQVFITGDTSSGNYPTSPGAFDRSFNGLIDAYVTKLDPSGSSIVYSTFLGAGKSDLGVDLAVEPDGSVTLTGDTFSTGFPTTPGAFDRSRTGSGDAFVSRFGPAGKQLTYSSFLGGGGIVADEGKAIGLAGPGVVTVGGWTASPGFPTTPGAYDRSFNGVVDVFVASLRVIPPKATRRPLGFSENFAYSVLR
jgi:hypothetical protein